MGIVGAFLVPHPPLIVGEVGQGRQYQILKTIEAYKEVAKRIALLKPETIIVTSPHSVMYSDFFHISPGFYADGDFSEFGAPKVRVEAHYDSEFVTALTALLDEKDFAGGTLGEREKQLDHGTMIPLYFVNQEYKDYKLVRIGISGQSFLAHYTLGEYIKRISEQLDRRTVFIASGDLSHRLSDYGPYGYKEEGPTYDERVMDAMSKGEFGKLFDFSETFCDRAAECGHRSFLIMAGALDQLQVHSEKLSYEGPFGVGYGVCAYSITGKDKNRNFGTRHLEEYRKKVAIRKENEDEYVQLARKALETFVMSRSIIEVPNGLPEEMNEKAAGVFVSIKKGGQLRGCIGTTEATKDSVAEEIIQNAISAGMHDPRFEPVKECELDELVYSVDVLGPKEKVGSEEDLDVERYGVIVKKGRKQGLLLPNLEGIDSVSEQILIARKKAGIDEEETVELERFEVIRHK